MSKGKGMEKSLIEQIVEDLIVDAVSSSQGLKAVELPGIIYDRLYRDNNTISDEDFDIPLIINRMVIEKKIVEVQYVLPTMQYRMKSFLLPAGTAVNVSA